MSVLAKIVTNSLIFGDKELGNLGVIEYVDRPFLPPINPITKEITGRDGVIYKTNNFGPLTIRVSIRLFNDITRNIDDIIFDLMELVYSKETKSLNYKGKRVWYDAVLVDVSSYEKFRNSWAYMDLDFLVPSGFGRSCERYESESFTTKTINMSTVCPTRGIFSFTGSSNKITNMRTGEFIEILNGTSVEFTIDCEKEIVMIKSNRAMDRLSYNSSFFDIKNGDKIVAKNPVKLKYYERYLYDR